MVGKVVIRGQRQRGAALVVAMLIAAIAAAVATTLSVDGARRLSVVEGRRDHARATSLATAGVQWARQTIEEDGTRGPVDHHGEPWAIALPATPVDGGTVQGRIEDAQARLNVNAVAGIDDREVFVGLHVELDRPGIVAAPRGRGHAEGPGPEPGPRP